jgi:hypothetical protein
MGIMRKKFRNYLLLAIIAMVTFCSAAYATLVSYNLKNLCDNQYEYTYTIKSDTLSIPIQEFTIWFDIGLYRNLVITTAEPLAGQWDEIILKDTGFGLSYGYDALALNGGIQPLETMSGFSVKFDWLDTGKPAGQFFEVIDPVTFETIESGYSVPEPSTLLMFSIAGLIFRLKLKSLH